MSYHADYLNRMIQEAYAHGEYDLAKQLEKELKKEEGNEN